VWRQAYALALDSHRATQAFPREERYALGDQIRRSAVSVPANIAEGASRGRGSFAQFLRIAAGSAAELETQLEIASDLGFVDATASRQLLSDTRTVRNMLWGLIRSAETTALSDDNMKPGRST
jgi:four helix bundle protein